MKLWIGCLPALVSWPLMAQTPAQVRGVERLLSPLVESYGVSGMESPVREMVQRFLPAWAKAQTDTAGNLWLTVGRGQPTVVFVAHLDEVGFTVDTIRDDGLLEASAAGGFFSWLWQGRPALVHTDSMDIPGVFVPPDSSPPDSAHASRVLVDVGSRTRDSTRALGLRPGYTVTSPKSYARLAGPRATGRSFDDRVGSTALLLAVRRLDPRRLRHTVVFIWSVREEIGLEGAEAVALELGLRPARVHAIDTFVSADAPLENPRFALAPLGLGPVARALDNSTVTPPARLDSLIALARAHRIPLQVGATNGGNDGAAFAPYGVPDVALGWPLRYSHSPVEVIDLRDVVNLGRLVQAIAQDW
ncbi:MAG TPA: M20/M25/M40 family metallo-hydrolase [Gemmatimonadales bacterium]|jgi:putative aminopeptidase FrvX